MSTDTITTLPAHLAAQAILHRDAHALMPFKVDACSYPLGALRQKISSCRTCGTDEVPVGVCYACSVSCHAEHDLVELFTRRNFTCDCPASLPSRCTLLRTAQPRTPSNAYTRNFRGEFCRCARGKRYDPMEESECMIECLACQDWFHESCLNLQDPSNPTPLDTASQSTTSSIESPILPSTSYAHLLCAHCITTHPLLRRYAGTPGWCMIVPRPGTDDSSVVVVDWPDRWDVIGRHRADSKRAQAHSPAASPPAKRPRLDADAAVDILAAAAPATTSCTLPAPNARAQRILDALALESSADADPRGGGGPRGDVFLLPSARESICTCPACIAHVEALPFPLEDEPEYEPAEDSPEPTEESLASRALEGLPRAQTIEALLAFNAMKDKLKAFLEPFRDGGRVVSAEDIGEFMQSVKQGGK